MGKHIKQAARIISYAKASESCRIFVPKYNYYETSY